jgi:hypothetical protein
LRFDEPSEQASNIVAKSFSARDFNRFSKTESFGNDDLRFHFTTRSAGVTEELHILTSGGATVPFGYVARN